MLLEAKLVISVDVEFFVESNAALQGPRSLKSYLPIETFVRTVQLSRSSCHRTARLPFQYEWIALVQPPNPGVVYAWKSASPNLKISSLNKLKIPCSNLEFLNLELSVSTNLQQFNASMHLEVLYSLITFNISLPIFLAGQENTIILDVEGILRPNISIDFGDGSVYNNLQNSSMFNYHDIFPYPIVKIFITYKYSNCGIYTTRFNISDKHVSEIRSMVVFVKEPIGEVQLILLSSALVALFEEVTVEAIVTSGDSLQFEWDFGDETGKQYTTIKSFEKKSIAGHSYGVAEKYNISVKISNPYQRDVLEIFLNQTIQAIEPIEQLNIRTVSSQYSAALLDIANTKSFSSFTTKPITFEARLWRGSNVEFLFNFGNGYQEKVSAVLDIWSSPYGITTHTFTHEGAYVISVTALNPLGFEIETLEELFYVQFPPDGLNIGQKYHILPLGIALPLYATILIGTNVSFSWKIENEELNITDSKIELAFAKSGVYTVSVEATNKVTDETYNQLARPHASAKIYVQEPLQEIYLCIKYMNEKHVCDGNTTILPVDREIEFIAKVIPTTETIIRYIWEIGLDELKKTNAPTLKHRYRDPGLYTINVTAQNHISKVSSETITLLLIQKVGDLTGIHYQGPNIVNQSISYTVLYWFGTNLTFKWHFGDKTPPLISNSSSMSHTYGMIGEYIIVVEVWNMFSQANITTNMFILEKLCMKPEVSFVDQCKDVIAMFSEEILIEVEVLTSCDSSNAEYQWSVMDIYGTSLMAHNSDRMAQHYLLLPAFSLSPGSYTIMLKVSMADTIVYESVETSLTVLNLPHTLSISGGYMRTVGYNDTISITAVTSVSDLKKNISFHWYCSALMKMQIPCFKSVKPKTVDIDQLSRFTFSASLLDPRLKAVIMNVSINEELFYASQIIEIMDKSHALMISIYCEKCKDHSINLDQTLLLISHCENCDPDDNITYSWKVWIVQDGMQNLHFSHYQCVEADGSTFFIMASNSTEKILTEDIIAKNGKLSHNADSEFSTSKDIVEDNDFPPFPNFPGVPVDDCIPESEKVKGHQFTKRLYRPFILNDFILENDAVYDHIDNDTKADVFSLQAFIPPSTLEKPFYGPDFEITEEGLPGESGSAAARDQSLQRLGVFLSGNDNEDHILEGTANGRMNVVNVPIELYPDLSHNVDKFKGDPVKDNRFIMETSIPHLINQRKLPFTLNKDTATGFDSEDLILESGALRIGSSYVIEVTASKKDNPTLNGFAMEYVKVNVGPVNGRCSLMPTRGYSLNFTFRVHCLEWESDHLPLSYQLIYSMKPHSSSHLIYYGLNRNIKFILPAGLPEYGYNVYLNIVVSDKHGTATKVCSLICQVLPLEVNGNIVQYIYNATFYSKFMSTRILHEKGNQVLLQRIHVWVVTLNIWIHSKTKSEIHFNSEETLLLKKIRLRYLEIIENLNIYTKAEAAECFSILKEIFAGVGDVEPVILNKGLQLLIKMLSQKSQLQGSLPNEILNQEVLNALEALALVANAHIVYGHVAAVKAFSLIRNKLLLQVKEIMPLQSVYAKPYTIQLQNFSFTLKPVDLQRSVPRGIFLKTKYSKSTLWNFQHFFMKNKHILKKNSKKIVHSNALRNKRLKKCIAVLVNEHTLIADVRKSWNSRFISEDRSHIVSFTLFSCDTLQELSYAFLSHNEHLEVNFYKEHKFMNEEPYSVLKNHVNAHVFDITENDIQQSLHIYVKLKPIEIKKQAFMFKSLFSYRDLPSLTSYLLKMDHIFENNFLHIIIPGTIIRSSGFYYFVLINSDSDEFNKFENLANLEQYELSAWQHSCVQKLNGTWTTKGCSVLLSSTINEVICQCKSLFGISSFSRPFSHVLKKILINDFSKPYFPTAAILFLPLVFILYIILLVPIYLNDRSKRLRHSPVLLKSFSLNNKNNHNQDYLISVRTGSFPNAGTSASVYIVLHGKKNITETILLTGNDGKLEFAKGSMDEFVLSVPKTLGTIQKLQVWHNNFGPSPSWYLKDITVKDNTTEEKYCFICYEWLAAEKGDCKIERELCCIKSNPGFAKIFLEVLFSMHSYNIWNSILCNSPRSCFTGVQKLTCCFCFILNSAAMLSFPSNFKFTQVEKHHIAHISTETFIAGFVTSILVTLFLQIPTILFLYSFPRNWEFHLKGCFTAVSPQNIFLWLQARSFYSKTNQESQMSSGQSDSLNSIYSSSNFSNSEMNETTYYKKAYMIETTIPSELQRSVSPFQKAVLTWQTIEALAQSNKEGFQYSTNELDDEVSLHCANSFENKWLGTKPSRISCSMNFSDIYSFSSDKCSGEITLRNENCTKQINSFGVNHKFLRMLLYYMSWLILFLQSIISMYFIVIKMSRFQIPQLLYWLGVSSISILSSCFISYPFLGLIISIFHSFREYVKFLNMLNYSSVTSLSSLGNISVFSFMKRSHYFMNYLRPPPEYVLLKTRESVLKAHFIYSIFREIPVNLLTLILLILMTFPSNNTYNYYQKTSIERAFMGSLHNRTFKNTKEVWYWMQSNFLNIVYGPEHCHTSVGDCGIILATGCHPVGAISIRSFNTLTVKIPCDKTEYPSFHKCHHYLSKNLTFKTSDPVKNFDSILANASMGYSYIEQEDTLSLNFSRPQVYNHLNQLYHQQWINTTSSTISIDLTLFNPTFTSLISVTLLFELNLAGSVNFIPIIVPLYLSDPESITYFACIFFQLCFILTTLINTRNQLWKLIQHGKKFWESVWNCFQITLIIFSFIFIMDFVLYVIEMNKFIHQLKDTNWETVVDVKKMASFDKTFQTLLSFVLFLHIIGCLRLLQLNHIMHSLMQSLRKFMKYLLLYSVIALCWLLNTEFLKQSLAVTISSRFPLVEVVKTMKFMKNYIRPEISNQQEPVERLLYGIILLLTIFINFFAITMVRATLISSRRFKEKNRKITDIYLSDIKNNVESHFKSFSHKIPINTESRLPEELLHLELELLGDQLLCKVNEMYSKYKYFGDKEIIISEVLDASNISIEQEKSYLDSSEPICSLQNLFRNSSYVSEENQSLHATSISTLNETTPDCRALIPQNESALEISAPPALKVELKNQIY